MFLKVRSRSHLRKNGRRTASDPTNSFNWKKAYQTSFKCTRNSKFIYFNFKFLHRRLATNSFLQKIGIKDNDKCTFCHIERENLIHLFWECEKQNPFWADVLTWIKSSQIALQKNQLTIDTALGLRPDNSDYKLQINFICLTAKYFIWISHSKGQDPTIGRFLHFIKQTYEIEKKPSRTGEKKWDPLVPYLQLETASTRFVFLWVFFCGLDWLHFLTILYQIFYKAQVILL